MKPIRTFLILTILAIALPAAAQSPIPFVIQPPVVSAIANGTITKNAGTLPTCNALDVLLNISTTGTATGTLQVYVEDSADGGVTWDDVISSNTFALGAAIVTQRFFVNGYIASTATSGSAAAAETLTAGTTRQGPFAYLYRVREKLSGAAGSPVGATYGITAICK